jgi:hypothetical protein
MARTPSVRAAQSTPFRFYDKFNDEALVVQRHRDD